MISLVFVGTYLWWGTLSGAVTLLKKKARTQHFSMMNRGFVIMLLFFGTVVLLSACGKGGEDSGKPVSSIPKEATSNEENGGAQMQELVIEIDGQQFQTVLYDNRTTRAFLERLPMTLDMGELNGNEKFYYLDEGLPTNSQRVGSVKTGDIMLFGSDCLVLFFEEFSTSYSYSRIGHVQDQETFSRALTSGTVKITFQIKEGES